MMDIYISQEDGTLSEIDTFKKGCWVNLVNPTEEELKKVAEGLKMSSEFISDPLDSEEKARIEIDEGQTLIIVDVPVIETEDDSIVYETFPLGIVANDEGIVTICLKKNSIIRDFEKSRIKTFFTFKKTRFVFQMLFRIATYYLRYLKQINRETDKIEESLRRSMKNQEIFAMMNLQKSLVYFATSLKSNEVVMERLLRGNILKMYEEDQDILEDVIIENKQAIEMANTYASILNGMMDTFASVISNNLNIVMKRLASITIVMAIPTMVASFFGMNIDLPLEHMPYPYSFVSLIGIAAVISVITVYIFRKMKMF